MNRKDAKTAKYMTEDGYRLDMLVDENVVIENKTVDRLLPIHAARVLTYPKLGNRRLGFLLNGPVELIRNDTKRLVHESSFAAFEPLRFNTPAPKSALMRD